jgi:hypothetical protein
MSSGSLTMTSSSFAICGTSMGAFTALGGSIALISMHASLHNVTFEDGNAETAGAISISSSSDVYIKWCSFHGHKSSVRGIAIDITTASKVEIVESSFTGSRPDDYAYPLGMWGIPKREREREREREKRSETSCLLPLG